MEPARCRVVHTGAAFEGRQGFTYLTGLSGSTVGASGISIVVLTLPDGAKAKTHLHRGIETAVYIIEAESEMFWGPRLEEHIVAKTGDFVYVPPDTAHRVMNRSGAPCRALVAHTAPDDQAGIVMLPELDAIHE